MNQFGQGSILINKMYFLLNYVEGVTMTT